MQRRSPYAAAVGHDERGHGRLETRASATCFGANVGLSLPTLGVAGMTSSRVGGHDTLCGGPGRDTIAVADIDFFRIIEVQEPTRCSSMGRGSCSI